MGAARCEHCRTEFPQKTGRRRFCSDRCRAAMSRWRKAEALAERDRRVGELLKAALR